MLTAQHLYSMPPGAIAPDKEARFFGSIRAVDGTFKRTATGRLSDIDESLVRALAAMGSRIESVLDIGVSSGVTALDLHAALTRAGHPVELTGTDLHADAEILTLFPGCRALIDREGFPLQYDIAGRSMRPWNRRLDYFTGAALIRPLLNRLLTKRIARVRARSNAPANTVKLVTPRLTQSTGVSVVSDDILQFNPALAGRFDLVRAANILNRRYFDEAQLRTALACVGRYLKGPGSWLLVVRTHGWADHHGTLFRMAAGGHLSIGD